MIINGRTKTVALIGDPVEHSFSPFIHNYGFLLNDLNMVYVNHRVESLNLEEAIRGIKALGYVGANITYPYKVEVMRYLDKISEEAKLIGAVNTIKNESGKLVGYNTDGMGFLYGLKKSGIDVDGKKICILGAGGAARSIIVSLLLQEDCTVYIANRTLEKAKKIYGDLLVSKSNFKGKIMEPVNLIELNLDEMDIFINATPVGMNESIEEIPLDLDLKYFFHKVVCDLIYQPEETFLLKQAKDHKASVHNGFNMLVGQGLIAFKLWTGKVLDFGEIEEYIRINIKNM